MRSWPSRVAHWMSSSSAGRRRGGPGPGRPRSRHMSCCCSRRTSPFARRDAETRGHRRAVRTGKGPSGRLQEAIGVAFDRKELRMTMRSSRERLTVCCGEYGTRTRPSFRLRTRIRRQVPFLLRPLFHGVAVEVPARPPSPAAGQQPRGPAPVRQRNAPAAPSAGPAAEAVVPPRGSRGRSEERSRFRPAAETSRSAEAAWNAAARGDSADAEGPAATSAQLFVTSGGTGGICRS